MSNAILIEHVSKKFRMHHRKNQYLKITLLSGRRARLDEFWAVKDISFDVPAGFTFVIIGSNGSGKSTLLKCLSGILSPDEDQLKINGRLTALLELGAGFRAKMSGRENIILNGAILGMTDHEIELRFDDIVEFAGLGAFIDTPVKNYSSGMVVRLGFAIAANVEPEILLIDEVLAVGDASFQQRCFEKIEDFRQDGRTIVLVSHGLSQVEQLCSTVAWLDKGTLRSVGDGYKIVSEYQGVSHNAVVRIEGEIGERWGSGEADITKVELLNKDFERKETFATGQPLTIRIHFDAHIPISEAVIGIRITHLHGTNVWGTNTKRRATSIPKIFRTGSVDLAIDSLPLLEGTYDLTIALSDYAEVHPFDHWEKCIRFDVHQYDTFDEGIVQIESTWKI